MTKRKFFEKDLLLPVCIVIVIAASCLIVTITAVTARIKETAEEKRVMACMEQMELLYQQQDIEGLLAYESENWRHISYNEKYNQVCECYSDLTYAESAKRNFYKSAEWNEGEDLQTSRENNLERILGSSIDVIVRAKEAIDDGINLGNEDLLNDYLAQATSYVVDFCGFDAEEIDAIAVARQEDGYHWKQYIKQAEKNIP